MMTTTPISRALSEMLAPREGEAESDRLARQHCHDAIVRCWGLRPKAELVLDLLGQTPEPEFEQLVSSIEAVGGLQSFNSFAITAEQL